MSLSPQGKQFIGLCSVMMMLIIVVTILMIMRSIKMRMMRFNDDGDCNDEINEDEVKDCLLYTSPSPRDLSTSRMPSSA